MRKKRVQSILSRQQWHHWLIFSLHAITSGGDPKQHSRCKPLGKKKSNTQRLGTSLDKTLPLGPQTAGRYGNQGLHHRYHHGCNIVASAGFLEE